MTYKHGFARPGRIEKLHSVWRSMLARCSNPNLDKFRYYGGRGITVCDEWKADYLSFRTWAHANAYAEGLTIERVDNDSGYSPGNCRWVDRKMQARNRRTSRLITHRGRTQTQAAWADETGISQTLIHARLNKLGWPVERALTTPVQGNRDD